MTHEETFSEASDSSTTRHAHSHGVHSEAMSPRYVFASSNCVESLLSIQEQLLKMISFQELTLI